MCATGTLQRPQQTDWLSPRRDDYRREKYAVWVDERQFPWQELAWWRSIRADLGDRLRVEWQSAWDGGRLVSVNLNAWWEVSSLQEALRQHHLPECAVRVRTRPVWPEHATAAADDRAAERQRLLGLVDDADRAVAEAAHEELARAR